MFAAILFPFDTNSPLRDNLAVWRLAGGRMSDNQQPMSQPPSRFYCYPVGIAPEEGRLRVLLAALDELRGRNRWLVRLRWLAVAGLVAAATTGRYAMDLSINTSALYWIAAGLFVYNLAVFLATRPAPQDRPERRLAAARFLATGQMLVDLTVLTCMLHFSGGAENPFLLFFVFHMIIGSILLTRAASFYIATFGIGLFFAMALAEQHGIVAHYNIWAEREPLYANEAYVFTVLAAFATTMYLSVYFAADIVGKLRTRDTELIGLTSSLEKGGLDLVEAYEKIRVLEERKSEFLRTAAHQLRSPLSAIRSLLDVVLDGYAKGAERQDEMLQRAHDRTNLMITLVNDLLVLSQLKDTARIDPPKTEVVSACEVIRELEALYGPRAAERGLRLSVSVPASGCSVLGTTDDMRQVLGNLLDNAINYTPAGGAVTLEAAYDERRLIFKVTDTGIGIPQESLPRLFEEFYRAPNAKAALANGTGLGLAIVKRTVEKWGGTVSVETKAGGGTTFTLVFPAV